MTPLSERERFCAQVFTAPVLKADAVVVLCGEDATARLATGCELIRMGCAPALVLSGGRLEAPRILSAASLAGDALGHGVAPDAVIIEDHSQNTHEQAKYVLAIAQANQWHRIVIVASAYHAPRALLTFIHVAIQLGIADTMHMLVVPSAGDWAANIPGSDISRLRAYSADIRKIDRYVTKGDCANYTVGLRYLDAMEHL